MTPERFNRLLELMRETHKPLPIETCQERRDFNDYLARRSAAKDELRKYFNAI